MKIRYVLVLTTLVVGVSGARAIWKNNNPELEAFAEMKQENQKSNPLDDLNEKAKRASIGNQAAVKDFVDEITAQYGLLEYAGDVTKEGIKDRIVSAEIQYQADGKGISEASLTQMINDLTNSLSAPDFMKTDVEQVRFLRVVRMSMLPNLINQRAKALRSPSRQPSAINSEMSPIEAMYIAMDLVHQKLNLEEWQVSPAEFRAKRHEKRKALYEARRSQSSQSSMPSDYVEPTAVLKYREAPKMEQFSGVSRRAKAMGPTEILELVNSSLKTIGINH
jgi:hypothetical protein